MNRLKELQAPAGEFHVLLPAIPSSPSAYSAYSAVHQQLFTTKLLNTRWGQSFSSHQRREQGMVWGRFREPAAARPFSVACRVRRIEFRHGRHGGPRRIFDLPEAGLFSAIPSSPSAYSAYSAVGQ